MVEDKESRADLYWPCSKASTIDINEFKNASIRLLLELFLMRRFKMSCAFLRIAYDGLTNANVKAV